MRPYCSQLKHEIYQSKTHKKSAFRRIFCFELSTTILRGQQLLAGHILRVKSAAQILTLENSALIKRRIRNLTSGSIHDTNKKKSASARMQTSFWQGY